jgi:hypothetical protein
MSKLTVSFKGHLLSVHHLEEQPVTIGRDSDCPLRIDSLAIAPRHAELVPTGTGWILLSLDPGFPVLLNNAPVDQASLHHGDTIRLGKHTLSFSEDSQAFALLPQRVEPEPAPEEPGGGLTQPEQHGALAYLQVQSGPEIGRVIVLRRRITRLSRLGIEDVLISRGGDGHRLTRLNSARRIKVDDRAIEEDDVPLSHKSVIEVERLRLCFFAGDARETATERAD